MGSDLKVESAKDELATLQFESTEIKNKLHEIMLKKVAIEAQLGKLTARIRGANSHRTRLSTDEYRQICNKQSVLKSELVDVLNEAKPLKQRLREIAALGGLLWAEIGRDRKFDSQKPIAADSLLRQRLIELRGKWLNFAEDQTRINSMRVLAAQFSREITDALALQED